MAKQKQQHLSHNHSKYHKVHHASAAPLFIVLALLCSLIVGTGVYGLKTLKENNKPLDSDYVSSELSKADFLKTSAPKNVQNNADKAAPSNSSSTAKAPTRTIKPKTTPAPAKTSQTAITGNANTAVAPTLPVTVTAPKTPIDSIRLFVTSVHNGDLKTANSLIGPTMAYDLATVAGSSDQALALEACRANSLCAALLESFSPPANAKETITSSVAQVSFKLSQSSPLLATLLGDQNLDIFLISYQGVWVIQNVYINGQPLVMAGL